MPEATTGVPDTYLEGGIGEGQGGQEKRGVRRNMVGGEKDGEGAVPLRRGWRDGLRPGLPVRLDVALVASPKNIMFKGHSSRYVEEFDHVTNNKVTATIESMRNGGAYTISDAITRLGALGGERALEGLTSVVSSRGNYINHHSHAIQQIFTIKAPIEKKVESLIRCSDSAVFLEVRDMALSALSEIGGDVAFDFLTKCLWEESAIEGVLRFGEEFREPLVEVSLSTIRSPTSVRNPSFGYEISGSWHFPDVPIHTILDYANQRRSWKYEYSRLDGACRVMRELGEDEVVVEECCDLLRSPEASVRHSAVYCIGKVKPKASTIEMLQEVWGKDDDQIVECVAGISLVDIVTSRFQRYIPPNKLPEWPFELRRMALLAILERDGEDRLFWQYLNRYYNSVIQSIMEDMDELEPSWRS